MSNQQLERTYDHFLSLLNVSTLDEARKLPSSALQTANLGQIFNSPFGQYTYGPTVDGTFVPKLPGELLATGRFDKSVRIMVGHNGDEGLAFTSPFYQNDTAFRNAITSLLPTIRAFPEVVDYISGTLYPPVFDGSQAQNYTDQIGRASAMISEVVFTCNTNYLNKAYHNQTYAYFFVVPPALHGSDNPYVFYDGENARVTNSSLAITIQKYITNFVLSGKPNSNGLPAFGVTGNGSLIEQFNLTSVTRVKDPTANARCNWWQKALYV